MASVGVCWVRVLCSGAVGLSLINGESKEENSLGPSSSLGLEMVQSFPDFTGTRTNLQHVCVSKGSNPAPPPREDPQVVAMGPVAQVFQMGLRAEWTVAPGQPLSQSL